MPSSSPTFVSASAARSGLCVGLGSTFRILLDAFVRDRSGGSLVVIGLSVPVLFGMVALAVDVGGWYSARRQYQTAADAAAVGAAWKRIEGKESLATVAQADAARNGVIVGGSIVMTINNPPTSGPNAGRDEAVEIIITVPEKTLLAGMVFSGSVTNKVRAVGSVITVGNACILALDKTIESAVKVWGETDVSAIGCILASNSVNAKAIDIGGDAVLTAQSLWSAGGVQIAGDVKLVE